MTTPADAPAPSPADDTLRVARSAGVVGAATMLSRVTGLVRDQAMATLFGAGFATDAFNVAFRIPNLLRDLFAEGAMSAAFVPTFTTAHVKRGDADAWVLGRQVMTALLLVLVPLCAIGWVFMPSLVRVFAAGFDAVPGKLELTTWLARVMLPFLPAVALGAVAMGMLNARGRFGVPALAPTMLNVGMVVAGIALIPVVTASGAPAILAMAIGVTVGGALQFGVQLPPLVRLGFRPGLSWPRHPGVGRIASLMLPATIGLAATQLNLTVSTVIASHFAEGSVSWLYYAFRLMQLPIGVFGVALATVSMTELSRAAATDDMARLKATLSATLRLVFLLTLPAAAWLAVMAQPVIALLFEHGRFRPDDTVRTAAALVAYCVGLPAFAAVGVLTRTFYALGETRVPVIASFVSVGVNLGLNLLFVGPLRGLGLDHVGLALATSATAIGNFVQLAFYLRRRVGPLEGRRLASAVGRVTAASAAIAGLCFALLAAVGPAGTRSLAAQAFVVGAGLVLGALGGWGAMRLLRVEELATVEALFAGLRRRLGRGGGA